MKKAKPIRHTFRLSAGETRQVRGALLARKKKGKPTTFQAFAREAVMALALLERGGIPLNLGGIVFPRAVPEGGTDDASLPSR